MHKAAFAERPGRVPRGYFDALLPITKKLLARGLRLVQAADWLISEGVLPPKHRAKYMNTMRVRFTRFRRVRAASGKFTWLEELGMTTAHAVPDGTVKALCGAGSSLWLKAQADHRRCPVCTGYLRSEK